LRYIWKQVKEFNHDVNVSQKCSPTCFTGISPTTHSQQFPILIPGTAMLRQEST
jgi:hypothetical protein